MTRVVLVNHTPQATLSLILVFGFLQCQIRMYFLFDWHVAISNPTVIFMSPRRKCHPDMTIVLFAHLGKYSVSGQYLL